MDDKDFSVLMSIYIKETPEFLELCFSSIYLQSVQANEIVLILDGPLTNDLYEKIELWKHKLPIVTVPLDVNVGLGQALNIGLNHCKNDLVARMDTDDICHPSRFEMQLNEFLIDPNLSLCGSNISEFDMEPGDIISYRKVPIQHDDILKFCIKSNPFNHMTVMYKKSAVISSGGYKHLPWMEDWYLWLRMLSSGYKSMNISKNLVSARTGQAMIQRRSGVKYIKSEWLLTKVKISLSLVSVFSGIWIFLIRSVPRLLPKFVLMRIYLLSRKRNEKSSSYR